MFEDRSGDKEDTTLDPMEPMLSMKRGVNSVPWHPSSMPAPHIYKVTMLGAQKVGKSALVHRLVAHTFDPTYRPSRQPTQLFWRHTEAASGRDIMFEIEDTPGVTPETTNSGELSKAGRDEVERLIFPLVWFEKRRKDKEGAGADPRADEANPLLPGGAPKITGSTSGRKARAENGGVAGLSKSMKSMAGDIGAMASGALGGSEPQRANPIGEDRKRMGFVIVCDVSSENSFNVAYAIVDLIFSRLQFDVSDQMTCPVSMVIVGNKSDLRGNRRQVPSEAELRAEITSRYYSPHAEPRHSVEYVECSAQTNVGLESVMLTSLNRIRMLPSRSRIRTARMRVTGYFAQFKRNLYTCCPFCFELEECCKYVDRGLIRPCVKRFGLYSLICECWPCMRVLRFFSGILAAFLTFRWLCDWCPPFILRLRKEVTSEEEDADVEGGDSKGNDDDES